MTWKVKTLVLVLVLYLLLPRGNAVSENQPAGVLQAPLQVQALEGSPLEVVYIDCGLNIPRHARLDYLRLDATCAEKQELAYIELHESTFRETAKNPISSATGSFQFTDNSWEFFECEGSRISRADSLRCALKPLRQGIAYDTWYRWWGL